MKQGIIFDLDGTLWDSSKAVVDSWNEKLSEFPDIDCRVSVEQMQKLMGKTMDEIGLAVFHMLPRERALALLDICMKYENEYIKKHGGILFAGVEETLRLLKETYFLAIVSNCQDGYIEAFLAYHGLADYFDDLESFGRTGKNKAENIRLVTRRSHLTRAVYVGDIMGDYQSATEAGLPFIHAAYGFGSVPAGVPRIADIRELVQKAPEVLAES